MDIFHILIIVCPLIFFAAIVDSIAGGGGLISLPAYLVAGVPIHIALGTNKFSSACGTSLACVRFARNKKIDFKVSGISVIFTFVGSTFGSKMALLVDDKYLNYILLIIIPIVAIFIFKVKNFGEKNTTTNYSEKKIIILASIAGLFIGAYDGFVGPGTGTFLILIYTTFLGYDLVSASGNAKLINLASNVAALAVFIYHGQVMFLVGIPAAICGIIGSYIGSGLAIKKGVPIIKPVFTFVLVILLIKILWNIINI